MNNDSFEMVNKLILFFQLARKTILDGDLFILSGKTTVRGNTNLIAFILSLLVHSLHGEAGWTLGYDRFETACLTLQR